jgi:1,4-alpha-glucan branching enzyme
MVYSVYLGVNKVRRFLKITTLKYLDHYEVDVVRLAGYRGIARYVVNAKLAP